MMFQVKCCQRRREYGRKDISVGGVELLSKKMYDCELSEAMSVVRVSLLIISSSDSHPLGQSLYT